MIPFGVGLGGTVATDYSVGHSVRCNAPDSAYLNRTPGAAGNRKKWTFSTWIKRSKLEAADQQMIFAASDGSPSDDADWFGMRFYNDMINIGGWATIFRRTTRVFRDISAWYHLVLAVDTDHATAQSRMRLYVNGVEETVWTTNNAVTSGASLAVCNNIVHTLGKRPDSSAEYMNGYYADPILIDGQQLDASSFGETRNGQWLPKDISGLSRGTTGFYLPFSDGSSAAALGYDQGSGTNDWTVNNISVSAGAGCDWLADSPTNNYCTLNPVWPSAANITNGMLDSGSTAVQGTINAAEVASYWEVTAGGSSVTAGLISAAGTTNTTTVTANKVFGFKLTVAGALSYRNVTDAGSWTSITTGLSGVQFPYGTGAAASWNFGQRDFAGTADGSSLCTANLPTPSIPLPGQYMNVKTYTGTGSSLALTGVGFQPDLVWIKQRDTANSHFAMYDSVRGAQARLQSSSDAMESTGDGGLTAFDTDGFTVGSLATVNASGGSMVAWCFKKGASCGFDIVGYTGNATNRTISHGLGVAPDMIMVKDRGIANDWRVYHKNQAADPQTDYLALNTTASPIDDNTIWNDTAPTSSVFSIGTSSSVNSNFGGGREYIAYLFAAVPGFSSFGSYAGNGSADGVNVWLGFSPKFLLIKNVSGSGDWVIRDSARSTYNPVLLTLLPWTNSVTEGNAAGNAVDFLAGGFKAMGTGYNASSTTYVYAAFAGSPFKYANAR